MHIRDVLFNAVNSLKIHYLAIDLYAHNLQVWFCRLIWPRINALCQHCLVKARVLCAHKLWLEDTVKLCC